jgi:hypothetical protein
VRFAPLGPAKIPRRAFLIYLEKLLARKQKTNFFKGHLFVPAALRTYTQYIFLFCGARTT